MFRNSRDAEEGEGGVDGEVGGSANVVLGCLGIVRSIETVVVSFALLALPFFRPRVTFELGLERCDLLETRLLEVPSCSAPSSLAT